MSLIRCHQLCFGIVFFSVMLQACADSRAESQIEQGRQLYLSHGCAVCHGENGDGKSTFPRKLDPPPINFHDPSAFRNGNHKQEIIGSIKQGVKRPGSVMPSYNHLPDDELEKIASFVGSLAKNKSVSDQEIRVANAWVRWQPPSRPNSAAYLTIENNSSKEMTLTSVVSTAVENIEMHTMDNDHGVMKMRLAEEIKIPAGGAVEMKPQGLHFMLFGIRKPLERADKIPLTLRFRDGSAVDVEAVVKGPDEE